MRRISLLLAAAFVVVLAACAQQVAPTPIPPEAVPAAEPALSRAGAATELFFSEYVEGLSNNKALEVYNGTGTDVDLGAGGYNVQMFFNGSASAGLTIDLIGTVAIGDVFVLAQTSASAEVLAEADQTNGAGLFNGDDAVVLRRGTTILDVIGQVGFDPGSEWGSGLTSTADNTLRRLPSVCIGDPDGSNAFDPAVEWLGFATNAADGLGFHESICADVAPRVVATTPVAGATDVAIDANLSVRFSEPVTLAADWFDLACDGVGAVAVSTDGTYRSITIDPDVDLPPATACALTIRAAGVADRDGTPDPLTADVIVGFTTTGDLCEADTTALYEVQGDGLVAPLVDQIVLVRGVVVGDYEGPSPALRGFYLQDPVGDGDPATSDGVFVFNGNLDLVSLGDDVAVRGTVSEFQGQTQVSAAAVAVCGTGAIVAPTNVTLPAPSDDYLERYEGMLVRFPQTLYVTEHFQLGRFGQVVLSSDDRLMQPTQVVQPGAAASALQAENDLRRIIVDDALNSQNPDPIVFARGGQPLSASNTLRGGDTATGIVGVLTYTWAGNSASGNAYRVRPVGALGGSVPDFQPTNPRPTSAPEVGGGLRVGVLNVLNYFDTFDGLPDRTDNCTNGLGGTPADCRGADDATEFERQADKLVATILGMDAAVLGLVEIENDGYGSGSALQDLVDRLNAATAAGTWAFVDVDAGTGETNALGTDAIKVALLYRPALATPVGTTAALNTDTFVNGGDADARNRPALAQAFAQPATGGVFVAVVNHLKSKGSACEAPDAGDGQGNCNEVRTRSAEELAAWLATDPTGAGDPDVLILGDLNSYAMEDPIAALEAAGFINLQATFGGYDAYTYVFDGQWGSLDHALASSSLLGQATGAAAWSINADEPNVLDYNTNFKSAGQVAGLYAPDAFRSSDHDPLIVGLDLRVAPDCSAAAPSRATLWPPRHQFVSISIDGVTHVEPVAIAVTAVFQDEPVDAPGGADGSTTPDAVLRSGGAVDLRAERDETRNGRVYHESFVATDPFGQRCTGTVQVSVPRSQGRNGAAVDDGPLFDATLP